jgi:choline-sulfatase
VKKPGSGNKTHLVAAALDLIPTFCDYAGIAAPSGLAGRSVRALVEGKKPSRPWRDSLVVHNEFCLFNKSHDVEGRMLRTRDYTYVAYSKGERREQLTDVRKDPGEMHNLAVDNGHRQTLARHRRMLADACRATGDRFTVSSA